MFNSKRISEIMRSWTPAGAPFSPRYFTIKIVASLCRSDNGNLIFKYSRKIAFTCTILTSSPCYGRTEFWQFLKLQNNQIYVRDWIIAESQKSVVEIAEKFGDWFEQFEITIDYIDNTDTFTSPKSSGESNLSTIDRQCKYLESKRTSISSLSEDLSFRFRLVLLRWEANSLKLSPRLS